MYRLTSQQHFVFKSALVDLMPETGVRKFTSKCYFQDKNHFLSKTLIVCVNEMKSY